MRSSRFAAIAAALLLNTVPTLAATPQEIAHCEGRGSSPELKIAGCTAVIESGDFSGHDLAVAYHNRGGAYADKKDFVRAIHDYDEAIQIDPSYAHAYVARAQAYARIGQYDRASEDFGEGVQLSRSAAKFFRI